MKSFLDSVDCAIGKHVNKCFDFKSNIMAVAYNIKKSTMESLSSFPSSKVSRAISKTATFVKACGGGKHSNDTNNKQEQKKKENILNSCCI